MTEEQIKPLADRVAVYLPVNAKGKGLSNEDMKKKFPTLFKSMKRHICPIDGGGATKAKRDTRNVSFVNVVEEGYWTCTACDLYGAHGCFHGEEQTR